MNLATLLEMAAEGAPDRVAVRSPGRRQLTYAELLATATGAATCLTRRGAERLVVVDTNSELIPVGLFGAALAGTPFVPVNYRLADAELGAIVDRAAPALVVAGDGVAERVGHLDGVEVFGRDEFLAAAGGLTARCDSAADPDAVAVMLFTSGTTGRPKAALLRHRHLTSYVLDTVEFMAAADDEIALVSVPPYHIAGIMAVLSSIYCGRRVVYLPQFDAQQWVDTVRREAVTHAMVVPTMLGRILDVVTAEGEPLPTLRHLSYGGGRMPVAVIERAMRLLPRVGLVNAYGLTETSSTVAVLTPEDHREALGADDPVARARLGSVGRPLPTLEVEIRDADGARLAAGGLGEVWVRGAQVSGEYLDHTAPVDDEGWFHTNDGGWLDEEGFLFVEGRLDDVIVRGAENLSAAEIEDTLLAHPGVAEAAAVGVPDDEWGEVVAAAVVLRAEAEATEQELQVWVRRRLRSARTPVRIDVRSELPYSETGKLLRRVLRADLGPQHPTG